MYVIWPRYTGRDKGAVAVGCDCGSETYPHARGCAIFSGYPMTFESEGDARDYIAANRTGSGTRVLTLEEYRQAC